MGRQRPARRLCARRPTPAAPLTALGRNRRQAGAHGNAALGSHALYEAFCSALRGLGLEVATGVFGARMQLDLVNDGPVTIVLG